MLKVLGKGTFGKVSAASFLYLNSNYVVNKWNAITKTR